MTNRYQHLFVAVSALAEHLPALRFLEIGTYDGMHAIQLLRQWFTQAKQRAASYYGFDLFEELTPEVLTAEVSKSRRPPSLAMVYARIHRELSGEQLDIHLTRGNTRETIPAALPELPTMDLIFIDGGHSLETIASDWKHASTLMDKGTIVLFDDHYYNRSDVGCQVLVAELEKNQRYTVTRLKPIDHYDHTKLDIGMVKVQLVTK